MFDNLLIFGCGAVGLLHLAASLVVRSSYRFSAKCTPDEIPVCQLPVAVASQITPRIVELERLGFTFTGCYDCGELAVQTRSYVAYFSNRSNDFANVTAMVYPRGVSSYLEFSTRFLNGLAIETNSNDRLPLTPGNPALRVFRFADIRDPKELYEMHRQLLLRYAQGLYPQGEPQGQGIKRWVRTAENYGPRHAKIGYMALSKDGSAYGLTWKGAFLVTLRGMWPVSLLRKLYERQAMFAVRRKLEHREIAALQKA